MLAVRYATPTAPAIARFAAAHWDIPPGLPPTLLHRGFNDVFALGTSYVLRLSVRPLRDEGSVLQEAAFLAHLHAAGVPVAAAIPAQTGALVQMAPLPGGARPAMLFPFLPGRTPELDDPDDARLQGASLAQVHAAGYAGQGRAIGAEALLHRPVAAVRGYASLTPESRPVLDGLEARLAARLAAAAPGLTRGWCHGDCHGLNARIVDGQAVLFDFDDCGAGWLAYDLAVHLWAQLSFGRRRHAMWHAFRRGYGPLPAADEAALPLFVAIRHLWLMGGFAAQTAYWGTDAIPGAMIARELAWLEDWERTRLGGSLL